MLLSFKVALDEEENAKAEVNRQLSRTIGECASWRKKYETESLSKIDELENAKIKLQIRLAEATDTMEEMRLKCDSLEKSKHRIQSELDDSQACLEKSSSAMAKLEKRAESFDKIVAEWKTKSDDLLSQVNSHKFVLPS